jgi:hypothetical protein
MPKRSSDDSRSTRRKTTLDELRRYDEPERLSADDIESLQEQLSVIGPWVYGTGTGGVHTASRLGTRPMQQASLTARGLLEAVKQREAQITGSEAVPVLTGLSNSENAKEIR